MAAAAQRGARRRARPRRALALLAGVAASTLTTALAAAVAGRQADLALQPVELALRVALLLGAPCAGALLAALVVPGGGRAAAAAVGVGVPVGPLLVLRLDRVRAFGTVPSLLVGGLLVVWGLVGAGLAAGWWGRPSGGVARTDLPDLHAAPGPPAAAPLAPAGDAAEPADCEPRPGDGA
jgi:hypothetical protein